jgi:hypothetical protein
MSNPKVINPKGTACWLVINTTLEYDQIAEFCGLHRMEVEAISNNEIKIEPSNPIHNYQLTAEEIAKCEKSETISLKMSLEASNIINAKRKNKKYVGIAKRNDALCAALYCIIKYPKLDDKKIAKFTGVTVSAIEKLRSGEHSAIKALSPKNPVLLGLATQREFDEFVK